MELTVNLENLSESERSNLIALVEKSAKPKSEVWKPKRGEIYYFIRLCNEVFSERWSTTCFDVSCWELGNCYKTREEAEFVRQHRLVEVELQRFAEEHNEGEIDWHSKKCYYNICYIAPQKAISWCYSDSCRVSTIIFTSEKIAQSAIEAIGKERLIKYYFGVKE